MRTKWRSSHRLANFRRGFLCALIISASAALGQNAASPPTPPASKPAPSNSPNNPPAATEPTGGLVIEPRELPLTYPHGPYHAAFYARGNYVPVLRWSILNGALPRGITLGDDGSLLGEAQRAGEFQFTVVVRDGGKPEQAIQKKFVIKVLDALTVVWKVPAHVNVNRIEGSVEVSNATVDDLDLTFDVKAVAENGRATEIGYQHFALTRGTIGMALPFGESLPHGAYVVYVNVNGEVAKRHAIYKQQMKTPAPLLVAVGP